MSRAILKLIPLLSLTSCLNHYEKEVVGSYVVSEYTLKDSTLTPSLPMLELTKEGTFTITQKDKLITGKWAAGDNGDWTWINFHTNNGKEEGRVNGLRGELISILNPDWWIEQNFEKLNFKRTK